MTRILVTEHEDVDLHRVRAEARRAGLFLSLTSVEDSRSFLAQLGSTPDVALLTLRGLPGMGFAEMADRARRAGAAVMVLGGDTPAEREILGRERFRYDEAFRRSSLANLPLLLDRLARQRFDRNERNRDRAESSEQLQQAAQQVRDLHKMATVGQLAGSIAHEINNPLESITNLIYLMSSDDSLPPQMRPYLDLAQQELNRVAQISKQTLSYFRETQEPLKITLSSLLEEVLVLYSRRIAEKKIRVVRRFESEEPVLAFPGEIRQVFANLLANAIEATAREGSIVVRLHRCHSPNSRNMPGMRVTIADSGEGISAESRRNLGRPFFTTKGQKGTGLGLWVSQTILKSYSGSMRLRSSTDPRRHGTSFSVFLPLELRPRLVEINGGRRGPALQPNEEPAMPGSGLQLMATGN